MRGPVGVRSCFHVAGFLPFGIVLTPTFGLSSWR